MALKAIVVSILALSSITACRYLLNNGLVLHAGKQNRKFQEADQRNRAKQADEHRDEETLLHCLAVAEAEYVSDLDREYNNAKVRGTFSRDGGYDLNPEIHRRIEGRKETSANNCQKEYGQAAAPSP